MPGNVTQEKPGIRPHRWDPETRQALAAEYTLGTLRGPALERFERLLAVDEDLRREVRHWEDRLAPMLAEVEPQSPPDSVWAGIEPHIGGSGPSPAAVPREGDGPPTPSSWWTSLNFWRGLAAVATLLLALVAGWSLKVGSQAVAPERMAVVTDPQNNKPLWVLSSGAQEGVIRVRTLADPEMGPDRVCPLWLRWEDSDRVQRVAVLPEEKGTDTFSVPRDAPLGRARLAVSIEPAGALPEDGPSGEVVYQGDWIRL